MLASLDIGLFLFGWWLGHIHLHSHSSRQFPCRSHGAAHHHRALHLLHQSGVDLFRCQHRSACWFHVDRMWQCVSTCTRTTASPTARPASDRQRKWEESEGTIGDVCVCVGLTALSDVFFSVWLNDIPAQMNTDIKELTQKETGALSFSSTNGFLGMQRRSTINAIRILEHALRLNRSSNGTLAFPRHSRRRLPYSVKSPGFQDDLSFYTNVLPLDIVEIPFNITRDFARGTRHNLPRGGIVNQFTAHPTLHAVDRDPVTCWSPRNAARPGDYFAIDFLSITSNVTFSLIVGHDRSLQARLEMRVSLDGRWWNSYRSWHGISVESNVGGRRYMSKITYESSQFTVGFRSFRYAMFKNNDPWKVPFRVCDVKILQHSWQKSSWMEVKKLKLQNLPLSMLSEIYIVLAVDI